MSKIISIHRNEAMVVADEIHKAKTEAFLSKTPDEAHTQKTPEYLLPLDYFVGDPGSPPHPDKIEPVTAKKALWVRFCGQWFRPYGNFDAVQIRGMIAICKNDLQIQALFQLLAAKR